MTGNTYKAAGVDIDAGERFAGMIADRVTRQWPDVDIGGFGGRFRVPPGATVATASADGDGTKPDLARRVGKLDVVGVGVVAMAAVDSYVDGSVPAAFCDYMVVEHLEPEAHIAIIDGVIRGCVSAGCRLVGGETAEHPGIGLPKGYVDVGGFCVGFPRSGEERTPRERIQPGMTVWGWLSHGLGSNGYSLARRVLRLRDDRPSRIQTRLEKYHESLGCTLADALLVPTAIHVATIEKARTQGVDFHGHAHITGGGMVGNIPRILPPDCLALITSASWEEPPIFGMIRRDGGVDTHEMHRTFNLGIQMVSVTAPTVEIKHPECVRIGEIVRRNGSEPRVLMI